MFRVYSPEGEHKIPDISMTADLGENYRGQTKTSESKNKKHKLKNKNKDWNFPFTEAMKMEFLKMHFCSHIPKNIAVLGK